VPPLGKGEGDSSSLESDADAAAVGAFSALYLGDRQAAAALGAQAQPQLRTGLRLQRCGSKRPSPPPWSPPVGRTTDTFDAPTSLFGKFTFEQGLDTAPTASAGGSYYMKMTMTPNERTSNAAAIGFHQIYRRGETPGAWSKVAGDPFMDAVRVALTDP